MFRKERLREMDKEALNFTSSIEHDSNIFYYDILVDVAHVLCLHKGCYLTTREAVEIINALAKVLKEGYSREFEDIHEAIEAKVTEITKEGKRMHTGRSRNDEIATCLRLFARDNLLRIAQKILEVQSTILDLAEKNDAIMPGFTHLQFAQPTRLSHHLLTYHDLLEKDFERVIEAFKRSNLCPLGASAFASTSYNLDRGFVAKLLGFDGILEHSEFAVSTRDFLIEAIFSCAMLMTNVSRIAEELIVFSTLGFVDIPEEFASTSSIMPQKKNPDVAELLRAKAGKMIGSLTSAMSIYKGLPLSYNRDFQEMNAILYETLKATQASLRVLNGMLKSLKFNKEAFESKASEGFSIATEIADMLVKDFRIPFRDAHKIVARLVSQRLNVTAENVEKIAREFGYEIKVNEAKLLDTIDVKKAVERRKITGGTAKEEVERMIKVRKEKILKQRRKLLRVKKRIEARLGLLEREVEKIGGAFRVDWEESQD
ncbi:MAG: argininosuccinate lyase [Archaeoglobaceae archaeon]